jgi:hypothetical protein
MSLAGVLGQAAGGDMPTHGYMAVELRELKYASVAFNPTPYSQ